MVGLGLTHVYERGPLMRAAFAIADPGAAMLPAYNLACRIYPQLMLLA
jgi:hypothetical protein